MTDDGPDDDNADSGKNNGAGSDVVVLRGDEFDAAVLDARLRGGTIRALSKQFHVGERAITAAIDRALPPLTVETKRRLYAEDLHRLGVLLTHWAKVALSGGPGAYNATQLVIRIMERRAALCGYDSPVHARVEVIAQSEAEQSTNSTQALIEQLERICSEGKPPRGELELEAEPPEPPPPAA